MKVKVPQDTEPVIVAESETAPPTVTEEVAVEESLGAARALDGASMKEMMAAMRESEKGALILEQRFRAPECPVRSPRAGPLWTRGAGIIPLSAPGQAA